MSLRIVGTTFIKKEVFRYILEKHRHKHQCFDGLHFVCIKLNHEGTERRFLASPNYHEMYILK